jgi:hypothetical protein
LLVTLAMKDELYAKYVEVDPVKPNVAILNQLERFKDVTPADRALFFNKEQRQRIEKLFGEGIDHASIDRFLTWLERRSTVNVGEYPITLTNGQMKRAESNATFWKSRTGAAAPPNVVNGYVKDVVEDALRNVLGA